MVELRHNAEADVIALFSGEYDTDVTDLISELTGLQVAQSLI